MTLGPIMMDLAGVELDAEERERLQHPLVGGVLLFSRNYESPEQLVELTAAIRAARQPPLLIAVDQEGGKVQRFRDGFTRLPPLRALGRLYDRDPDAAYALARDAGWLMASELRACGVDCSFAPVLDLDRGCCPVIGDRAFHGDPVVVGELGFHYMTGMEQAGMQATGKHFPGHGAVREDSHRVLPRDPRAYEVIDKEDLRPFAHLIHNGLAAVMMAHVAYTAIEEGPASFSPFWVTEVLRNRLGFQGAVFSDDLSMEGAAGLGGYLERAEAALAAGCDMLPVCNHPEAVVELLDGLPHKVDPVSSIRLVRLHGRGRVDAKALRGTERWRETVEQLARLEVEPTPELDV